MPLHDGRITIRGRHDEEIQGFRVSRYFVRGDRRKCMRNGKREKAKEREGPEETTMRTKYKRWDACVQQRPNDNTQAKNLKYYKIMRIRNCDDDS